MTTVDLIVLGWGRMGRVLVDRAASEPGFRVAAIVDREDAGEAAPGAPFFTDLNAALDAGPGAVVVSFCAADGEAARVAAAARRGHPLVEGTTGLDAAADAALAEAARRVAVVRAPNMSPGMTLLHELVRRAATTSGVAWDLSVLDRHHRRKADAPSGTARSLLGVIGGGGREAEVASFRHGGVVGEHTVYFAAEHEELVLTHRAFDRAVFAGGALLAARFAAGAPAGLYGMADVLGLGAPEEPPR